MCVVCVLFVYMCCVLFALCVLFVYICCVLFALCVCIYVLCVVYSVYLCCVFPPQITGILLCSAVPVPFPALFRVSSGESCLWFGHHGAFEFLITMAAYNVYAVFTVSQAYSQLLLKWLLYFVFHN